MIRHFFQKIILAGVAISMPAVMNGQADDALFQPKTPTSPQAETFKKFGEYTLNNQMGVPDITIPLYEINHRGYKIPIALTYAPPTLKPGYNYDVLGSGWTLSFKSCITRNIYSIADEKSGFKIDEDKLSVMYNLFNDAASNLPFLLNNFNYGHDKYHAILPDGSSFDFVIDKVNGNLVYKISDGRQVIITCNQSSTNITEFTIIDESGVKYTFDGGDIFYDHGSASPNNGSFVSWQLGQIDLPYSDDPISIGYTNISNDVLLAPFFADDPEVTFRHTNMPYYGSNGGENLYTTEVVDNYAPPVKMKRYNYSLNVFGGLSWNIGGNVSSVSLKFNTDNNGHKYVTQIQIRDGAYSADIDLGMTVNSLIYNQNKQLLARLDSITIHPVNSDPLHYYFSYDNLQTMFNGLDHWGNITTGYNDGIANFNVLSTIVNSENPEEGYSYLVTCLGLDANGYNQFHLVEKNGSCSRVPDGPNSYGVLKKIVYPTGGYTEFQFENNQFLTRTDYNGDYANNPNDMIKCDGPGFRIRKIANYTADQKIADVKTYRYGRQYRQGLDVFYDPNYNAQQYQNAHTGLGIAVVDPNVLTYMKFDCTGSLFRDGGDLISDIFSGNVPYLWKIVPFSILNMVKGIDMPLVNPFSDFQQYDDYAWGYECRFSAANFRNLLNGRPPVIYPEITVYNGDIGNGDYDYHPENTSGKTVYQYDVMEKHDIAPEMPSEAMPYAETFFEEPWYYDNFNLSYNEESCRYNKLKDKTDYRYDFNLKAYQMVNQEHYDWKYFYDDKTMYSDWVNTRPFFMTFFKEGTEREVTLSKFFTEKSFLKFETAQLQQKTTTTWGTNRGAITTVESYSYNSRNQMEHKTVTNSDGKNYLTTYQYPDSSQNASPEIIAMVGRNMISQVVKQETSVNSGVISGGKTEYGIFNVNTNSIIMPAESYQWEAKLPNPEYVLRQQVLRYTANGNPMEVEHDGFHTVYLWGYDDRYLIAKIENTTYNDLKTALSGVAPETAGVTSINNLRNTPNNFMITTYTYQPPFGITSEIDPSGKTVFFKYDTSGRLIEAANGDGKILEEHGYNYAK